MWENALTSPQVEFLKSQDTGPNKCDAFTSPVIVIMIFMEETAQVSFEYLLTAVFAIMLAISAAILVEAMRSLAMKAQADILSTRSRVIENILTK